MNVYTDPKLLNVHDALDALPALGSPIHNEQLRATGTEEKLAPNAGHSRQSVSFPDTKPMSGTVDALNELRSTLDPV